MKQRLCMITGVIISLGLNAQTINIGFTGNGASSTVESVVVENLTQCTSALLFGNDILQLTDAVGINDAGSIPNNSIKQYPNPFTDICIIEFAVPVSGKASLSIVDVNGKVVADNEVSLSQGSHKFTVSGLSSGLYFVRIRSEQFEYSTKILSLNNKKEIDGGNHCLVQESVYGNVNVVTAQNLRNTEAVVQMQYNSGDILKFTGMSGIYETVVTLVPVADQTLSFTFIQCTDINGNNYPVVQIGNQWWMAENLNAGTYANITTPQVSGTKFCMDINGQPDPTCPMGGLYEWENLMQGASACNGTGAPPSDECTTPVKGLCPNGWHIPSHYEWNTLGRSVADDPNSFPYDMNLGVYGVLEGGYLKETCASNWWSPNLAANNISGFTALPGGDTWDGVFEDYGQSAYFWTSSTSYAFLPWVYALNYSVSVVGRSAYVKENGFSCRCVKD